MHSRGIAMPNQADTSIIRVGSVQGYGGVISVNYSPELGGVILYVQDTHNRRKAGIGVGLTDAGFQDLKKLLSQLDKTIESALQRRTMNQTAPAERMHEENGSVVISLPGSSVSLPSDLYHEVATLVLEGNTMVAASLISKSLNWISLSGAKELARAICDHQQAAGLRR